MVVSILPNISAPFISDAEVVGSRAIATKLFWIIFWLKRLSVTVGMTVDPSGFKLPRDKTLGPILEECLV